MRKLIVGMGVMVAILVSSAQARAQVSLGGLLGLQGPRGPAGPAGPPGPTGAPGPVSPPTFYQTDQLKGAIIPTPGGNPSAVYHLDALPAGLYVYFFRATIGFSLEEDPISVRCTLADEVVFLGVDGDDTPTLATQVSLVALAPGGPGTTLSLTCSNDQGTGFTYDVSDPRLFAMPVSSAPSF